MDMYVSTILLGRMITYCLLVTSTGITACKERSAANALPSERYCGKLLQDGVTTHTVGLDMPRT